MSTKMSPHIEIQNKNLFQLYSWVFIYKANYWMVHCSMNVHPLSSTNIVARRMQITTKQNIDP